MSDEDTNELLRQILASQKEICTHFKKIAEKNESDGDAYKTILAKWDTRNRRSQWIAILHTITMAGVVGLLIYVAYFVLHQHLHA